MDDEQRVEPEKVDEINLLDYLLVLLKRKRLVITITLVLAIVTAAWSLITPKIYRAETKILPPQQSGVSGSQLLAQLSGVAGLGLGAAAAIRTPGDLYVALLKSRPVVDVIVDRFHLVKLYETNSREEARDSLLGNLKVQDDKKSGILTVGVEDRDPKRAADLANALVEELKRFNKGLAVTEASQRRLFYEEQLKDVKESLTKAEESMKGFQESSGAVKIDDQARAVIQSISILRAQIAGKEVQLKVMRTYATQQNPDIQRGEEELKGLREQLNRLEAKGGRSGSDPLMPTGSIPQLGTDYVRKMRDLKFNEALFEILLKQYEAAKLDEARDATVIQVIEKAIPPEKKTKPKRTQMVMIAGIIGFFISIFAAFFMEFLERSRRNPDNRERFELLKQYAAIRRVN
jgi:tyrosine-protein kinase Etk/Wzc